MALQLGRCLLRYYRTKAGLTQECLADRLRNDLGLTVSSTMISQYENDHRPMSPLIMRGVCIILGCTEADLYEWPH